MVDVLRTQGRRGTAAGAGGSVPGFERGKGGVGEDAEGERMRGKKQGRQISLTAKSRHCEGLQSPARSGLADEPQGLRHRLGANDYFCFLSCGSFSA